MLKKPLFNQQKYLDAFIKTAQYLASLTTQQDVWSEMLKVMTHFFGSDLVAFGECRADGEIIGYHWALPEGVSCENIFTAEIKEIINEVLEGGFLATHQIYAPEEYSIAILPIKQENQTTAVMLVGNRMSEPLVKELLNVYLAVAGLIGATTARLVSEAELRRHRNHLEKLVRERRRAEKALSESEEKYRLLVENANEAILVAQDDKHRFVNPKMVEMTGYSREELMSAPFFGFIHSDDRKGVKERYRRRLKGEEVPQVYPFRIVDKDGNTKWVEINAVKFNWEGRPAALGLLTDITERKKAEEAVKNSAREWHVTFDAIRDPVFLTDLAGKILRCNEAMVRFLRKPFSEIVGQNCRQLVCRLESMEECPLRRIKKSHRREMGVLPIRGRHFELTVDPLFDKTGDLIGAVHIMTDITERKKAQDLLRKEHNLLQALIDNTPDYIYFKDDKNRFIRVNKARAELSGTTPENMIGKTDSDFFLRSKRKRFLPMIIE